MKRTHSTMTAEQLEAWMRRHGHTFNGRPSAKSAAPALGQSRRTIAGYLAGQPIPEVVALLCEAHDTLVESRRPTSPAPDEARPDPT